MKNASGAFLSLVLAVFTLHATNADAARTIYDEKADGEELIAKALEKAKAEGKQVAIVWGANWCGWCHRLDEICRRDVQINHLLVNDYVLVHIDLGHRSKHMKLAKEYGLDFNELKIPHLTVHNQEGKLLAQMVAKKFFASKEASGIYSAKPTAGFLEEHKSKSARDSFPVASAQHHDASILKGDPGPAPVYSVSVYDPTRDPEEDLKKTVQQAKAEGKRILLQVGGDWCSWCHLMNKYFHENEAVAKALLRDFIIMKVNFSSENRNAEFLKRFPKIPGYPHLYVLDADGKLLHSQGTGVLEEGRSYSEEAVLKFLSRWAPKRSS